jgi:glutathione S-transferase
VERGQQDALTFTILDEIDAALWTAAKHSFILPEDRRVPAVKDTLKWEFESSLSRIADACVGPFLMGDKMTIPDILLVHCLRWADSAGFPSPAPALIEYQQHLQARPAFQRVLELP